jgi:hypothetical protein
MYVCTGEYFNKRKGQKVKLRVPNGVPVEAWEGDRLEGGTVKEASRGYKSRPNPVNICEQAIQAVKLRYGHLGLRFMHCKHAKPVPQAMISSEWLMDGFEPVVGKIGFNKTCLGIP